MLKDKLIEGEELAVAVAKHAFENKAKKLKFLISKVYRQLLIIL